MGKLRAQERRRADTWERSVFPRASLTFSLAHLVTLSSSAHRLCRRLLLLTVIALAPSYLIAQGIRNESARPGQSTRPSSGWRAAGRDGQQSPDAQRLPAARPIDDEADNDLADDRQPLTTHHSPLTDARFVTGRQVWRDYDLAPYTARLTVAAHPEQAVVAWILKQTGPETWHGEDVAVLSATRGKLRVFHTPEVQAQVAEIVERFVRPSQSQIAMRFEFLTCTDLDWRSGLVHVLKPVAAGEDGQQVWLIAPEDAALVRERLERDRQYRSFPQQHILASNGQAATVEMTQAVNYISGLELMTGVFLAYQPIVSRLTEGVQATITPLWTSDAAAIDLELKLSTRVLTKLHYAQSAAPLSTGSQNTVVQVPESASTVLDQTVRWPTPQILLISAGVHPGILGTKRSVLSLAPPPTELLVLAEFGPATSARASARRPGTAARKPLSDSSR